MEKKFIKLYDGLNTLNYFKEKHEDKEIQKLNKSKFFFYTYFFIF